MCATSEDRTVLAFLRDIRLGHLPTTVEANAEWLVVRDAAAPSVAELDQVLANTGPGTEKLPNTTTTSNNCFLPG